MTKEQFNKFKEDFKGGVEVVKLQNKFVKNWKNAGFSSEDEYNKAKSEAYKKIEELESNMIKFCKHYKHSLCCDSAYTHWAYYCAKHRLNSEEIKNYVNSEFNKMKECKRNDFIYNHRPHRFDFIEEILEAYGEEIVHTN